MLFKFQLNIKKVLVDFSLSHGLSFTSPLSEIKILYNYVPAVPIHMLNTIAIKDDALKN